MFKLHPTLAADTILVARLPLCLALLMKDANYPWLILVPQRPNVAEIHQLTPADRTILIEEIAKASLTMETVFAPDKINVAMLGNLVKQLHAHIVARFTGDPAWPLPIWGKAPPKPYEEAMLEKTVERIKAALE